MIEKVKNTQGYTNISNAKGKSTNQIISFKKQTNFFYMWPIVKKY